MLSNLLDIVGLKSEFASEARSRGLTRRIIKVLEPAALHLNPDDPGLVLQSRELLERTAIFAAVGESNNLELNFQRVDLLAQAFELLGLTRVSDIPDPFRRVWVCSGLNQRIRGVALTCENGEIAVFCPPGAKQLGEGTTLELAFRGFSSPISFPLKLNDSCLFPGGLMLHLTRPEGQGLIGRSEPRFHVQLEGAVNRRHLTELLSCAVMDMSLSGLRMQSSARFDAQEILSLSLDLDDGIDEPLSCEALVCWTRRNDEDLHEHGLTFHDLHSQQLHRLQQFLQGEEVAVPKAPEASEPEQTPLLDQNENAGLVILDPTGDAEPLFDDDDGFILMD